MKYFQPTLLNISKRPELLLNEVILNQQANIGLYEGKTKVEGYQDGVLYLTTHRIIYVDNQSPVDHSIHIFLESIIHIDQQSRFLRSSPKLIIYLDPEIDTSNTASTLTNGSNVSENESLSLNMAQTKKIADNVGIWDCPICSHHNTFLVDKCGLCGVTASHEYLLEQQKQQGINQQSITSTTIKNIVITTSPSSAIDDGIHCPACTYINHPGLKWCEICDTELDHNQPSVPPSLPKRPPPQKYSKSDPTLLPLSSSLSSTTSSINKNNSNVTKRDHFVQLSFHNGGLSQFLIQLNESLKEKAWETISVLSNESKSTPTSPIETRKAGIQSIEQKIKDTASENRDTLTNAFQDLEGLMEQAKKIVKLAERISSINFKDNNLDNNVSKLHIELGISNPVTRDTAGSIYHQELAREISELLSKYIKPNEMKTLTDVYCMVNRARGVALISPEDLYTACQQFERLELPFKIRLFENSGLLVVQSIYMDDDKSAQKILSHLKKRNGHITALELAEIEKWAIAVALEQLKMAEQKGVLCRDQNPSGLVFYENLFV